MRTSNEFNVGCLNAGTGIKYFISKNVGIRVEYRYQKYSDKNEESNGNYTYENEYQIKLHSFLFGLSVLL
jgi:opacity protein-like surface antigen